MWTAHGGETVRVLRRFSQTVCIMYIENCKNIGTVLRYVPDSSTGFRVIAILSTATVQLNRKAERARLLTDAVKCVYNLSRGCGGDSGGYTRARKAYSVLCVAPGSPL